MSNHRPVAAGLARVAAVLTVSALSAALSAAPIAAQTASLVYRLGNDTVAIEQYTRTSTALSGDMVQRNGPTVTRIQYNVTLGANGRPTAATFKRLLADGSVPPGQPREYRLQLRADSAIREVVFADSVQRRAFAAPNALIISPTFAYGLTELIAMARAGGGRVDSIPAIGVTGNVGFAGLEPAGDGQMRLRGGPYAMLLRFDANHRLQHVDGSFTTNKSIATRAAGTLNIDAIARAMKPTGTLSVRDVARGSFGPGGMVLIDYGRPSVRGRTVWGGTLIPIDSVWRAGANDATHLFTTRTLSFAGNPDLPPGQYSLWVQHTRSGTFLIVNRQTGQWGTQYDPSQDVARLALTLRDAPSFAEEFTISVNNTGGNNGSIVLAWGDKTASIPFVAKISR